MKNANDGAIELKRSLTITSTGCDRRMDRQTDGHGMTAKTALTCSISRLKHVNVLLQCLNKITYLLTALTDSNSKL